MSRLKTPPGGYRYVRATPDENRAWFAKYGGYPTKPRLECDGCGRRIWGSGLGIGAHRRACPVKYNLVGEVAEGHEVYDAYQASRRAGAKE